MITKKLFSTNLIIQSKKLVMANPGKFLYFAYGSNLSTERIHLNNPSAVAKGPALLKGFKLNFNYGSNVSVVKPKWISIFLYLVFWLQSNMF